MLALEGDKVKVGGGSWTPATCQVPPSHLLSLPTSFFLFVFLSLSFLLSLCLTPFLIVFFSLFLSFFFFYWLSEHFTSWGSCEFLSLHFSSWVLSLVNFSLFLTLTAAKCSYLLISRQILKYVPRNVWVLNHYLNVLIYWMWMWFESGRSSDEATHWHRKHSNSVDCMPWSLLKCRLYAMKPLEV